MDENILMDLCLNFIRINPEYEISITTPSDSASSFKIRLKKGKAYFNQILTSEDILYNQLCLPELFKTILETGKGHVEKLLEEPK